MKNLIFACTLTFSLSASYDVSTENFIQRIITPLSADQQQLIANFIYFSCATAWTDCYVRGQTDVFMKYAWLVRQSTLTYKNNAELFSKFKKIAIDLEHAIQRQHMYLNTWQTCTAYIEALPPHHSVAQAIEEIRHSTAQAVEQWALNHQKEFTEDIAHNVTALQQVISQFDTDKSTYKEYSNFLSNDAHNVINAITNCSNIAETIQNNCYALCNTNASLRMEENKLQAITAHQFYTYYSILYAHIQQLNPQHRMIMFDTNGIIPAPQREELLPEMKL